MVECRCQACGKAFFRYPSQVAVGEGKFCSQRCKGSNMRTKRAADTPRWTGGQVACTCLNCQKTFYVDRNRVAAGRGKHCSKACYWAAMKGPDHRWYRDGSGPFGYSRGWNVSVRNAIIARDKVCQDCGVWNGRPRCMQVHHLDFGRANHAPENLVLLCIHCHKRRHAEFLSGYSSGQSSAAVVPSAAAI